MLRKLCVLISVLICACSVNNMSWAEDISIMSYNIRYDNPDDRPNWTERYPHLVEQIHFFEPDILGVQEALIPMVNTLSQKLPAYAHYGVGRDDGEKKGESTTVFYKRERFDLVASSTQWCSETPDIPSKSLDAALSRTFTRVVLKDKESGQLLDVRNAHLDHRGPKSRLACAKQMKALAAFPKAVVLVLGDFNALPDSAPYKEMRHGIGLQLEDTRIAAPIVLGAHETFNDFDLRVAEGPFDYIFAGPEFQVNKFATLTDSFEGKVISDHYPVYAELEFSNSSH